MEATFDHPGPSTAQMRRISGSTPGMLDPTQGKRLHRIPNSKLSFAAFNPLTASTPQEVPDLRKLSLNEELYRPKRVVVETALTGESYWRFVPSAGRDDGVPDEGQWPRVVEICGELVECSQNQWDIYKLDPLYDCRVRSHPKLTVISKVTLMPKSNGTPPGSKRRVSSPLPEPVLPPINPRKKVRRSTVEPRGAESDEESEVEDMIIDGRPTVPRPRSVGSGGRAKVIRDEIRKARREKLARRAEWLARQDDEARFKFSADHAPHSKSLPPESVGKRKVNSLFDSLRSNGHDDHATISEDESHRNNGHYLHSKHSKRRRTVSPASAKRELEGRRLEREKRKQTRREQELNARRQQRDAKFLNELYAEATDLDMNDTRGQGTQEMFSVSSGEEEWNEVQVDDEDAARQAAIAESRRKLAELEADRPLWEEQAKKRMEREKAEEKALRAKAEDRRRAEALQAEADRRKKARQEQEANETSRREREEMARRARDRRQRQQRWSYGPWTVQRALERYKVLCEFFDATKFTACEPLAVDVVPWPVLQSPVTFSVEDVNWGAVEKFFQEVKGFMRPQDYKTFVEKSHRRFHPDRWRSRSLLKSVIDDTEKSCMEVAANTVAQALTPIWQELNGR